MSGGTYLLLLKRKRRTSAVPAITDAQPQLDSRGGLLTITLENMPASWAISSVQLPVGNVASSWQKNSDTEIEATFSSCPVGSHQLRVSYDGGAFYVEYPYNIAS